MKMAASRPAAEPAQLVEAECLFAARSVVVVSKWLVAQEPREIFECALRRFPLTHEELLEVLAA